ncbi:uncharacterized protein B0H18DRAFT_988571 [Fomitopsis serialis]|uniref:uncharacterized protein n=1 Tax=Fomitopsis serialis TaxID=139415 RepID=UPI0020089683|nr:uncharacterized protein B0H18DRAFT_988571 [Neoantrodia serialis]KAH9931909.1 hypothetical protein B0H18DRAFT_988571 [Neoantrodia serialis]
MELQEIQKYLNAIQPLCSRVSPLSPNASPRSRRLASTVCDQLSSIQTVLVENLGGPTGHRHGGTSRAHRLDPSGDAEEDEQSQDEPDGEGEKRGGARETDEDADEDEDEDENRTEKGRSTIAAKQNTVAFRVAKISQCLAADPLSLAEVADMLVGDRPKGKVADLEDIALASLLAGLPHASLHDWAGVLEHLADNIVSTASIVVASAAHDGVESITQRLEMRHKALTSADMGNRANNCVVFVLRQIETIKFALDWQDRGALPGGKKWISDFYKTAFIEDPAFVDEFQGITENAIKVKLRELEEPFKRWRNSARHTVTARNRLLRLYNMFGFGVLLDPTWEVNGLVRGRSRLFVPVLDSLLSVVRKAEPADLPSQSDARRALIHIVTILGGDDIGVHVKRFVQDHPPTLL